MRKLGKRKRFLSQHPNCCFCGGAQKSTTIDHVPPKACFPDGYSPEDFEFPACEACNHGSKRHDQIFGFYCQLLDFDPANKTVGDRAKLKKLRDAIARNYPDALPDTSSARPITQIGSIITPTPVAMAIERPTTLPETITVLGQKLTHALFYRETGGPLTTRHVFLSQHYQIQASDHTLTKYLAELLPEQTIATRTNIKNYGQRFAYKCGLKKPEDFFVYAAQFGRGLILWGMVLGPHMEIGDVRDYLRSKPWQRAGCRDRVLV